MILNAVQIARMNTRRVWCGFAIVALLVDTVDYFHRRCVYDDALLRYLTPTLHQ